MALWRSLQATANRFPLKDKGLKAGPPTSCGGIGASGLISFAGAARTKHRANSYDAPSPGKRIVFAIFPGLPGLPGPLALNAKVHRSFSKTCRRLRERWGKQQSTHFGKSRSRNAEKELAPAPLNIPVPFAFRAMQTGLDSATLSRTGSKSLAPMTRGVFPPRGCFQHRRCHLEPQRLNRPIGLASSSSDGEEPSWRMIICRRD